MFSRAIILLAFHHPPPKPDSVVLRIWLFLSQILIAPDILGLTQGVTPKFVKSYGSLADSTIEAFAGYAKEI